MLNCKQYNRMKQRKKNPKIMVNKESEMIKNFFTFFEVK